MGVESYTCLRSEIKSQKGRVRLVGCWCGCVWCPRCGRKSQKKIRERLEKMDWRLVRHVILTVNRDLFVDGEEAWRTIAGKKVIAGLIRNLGRQNERIVGDWLWVCEFHKDGFPHWHVLVEVAGGMIGRTVLGELWAFGAYIREEYIRNEQHWKRMVGYFGINGYFMDKGSQSTLPSWGMGLTSRIRRWGGKKLNVANNGEKKMNVKLPKMGRVSRPYYVILDGCGESSRVWISFEENGVGLGLSAKLNEKVENLKGGFDYEVGVGYVKEMSADELMSWVDEYKCCVGLKQRLISELYVLKVGDLEY